MPNTPQLQIPPEKGHLFYLLSNPAEGRKISSFPSSSAAVRSYTVELPVYFSGLFWGNRSICSFAIACLSPVVIFCCFRIKSFLLVKQLSLFLRLTMV